MSKNKEISEIDLFVPVYKVTLLITEMSQRFPKCYKTNIADSMINKMINCIQLLIDSTYGGDVSLELKKTVGCISALLRLCVDLKIISVGKFAEITLLIEDIKKLLGCSNTDLLE